MNMKLPPPVADRAVVALLLVLFACFVALLLCGCKKDEQPQPATPQCQAQHYALLDVTNYTAASWQVFVDGDPVASVAAYGAVEDLHMAPGTHALHATSGTLNATATVTVAECEQRNFELH